MANIPAFPQNTKYMAANGAVQFEGPQGGMHLRDYFAAQWLTTIVAGPGANVTCEEIAADCYRMADAMLKARNAAQ